MKARQVWSEIRGYDLRSASEDPSTLDATFLKVGQFLDVLKKILFYLSKNRFIRLSAPMDIQIMGKQY